MVRMSVCAYPWDLVGDPAAGERMASLGVGSVTLAAAYHTVRAATPNHPRHRVVDASSAALYVPVRPEAWRERRLVPSSAAPWAGERSFERAAAAVRSAGLGVEAWIVLTHSSRVGSLAPEITVRNAFGDRYGYALCPSNESVRAYATTLLTEVIDNSDVDSVVLEACGPLGVSHLGHHEKTAGADWTAVDESLLSICFCAGCESGLRADGIDPEPARKRIRSALASGAPSVTAVLGDAADGVLGVRQRGVGALRDAVTRAARSRGVRRIAFHATPDRWGVGPFSAVIDAATDADAYILPGALVAESDAADLAAIAARANGAALSAYVSAMPPATLEDLPNAWRRMIELGIDELCVYHGGLLAEPRLRAVREAVRSLARG